MKNLAIIPARSGSKGLKDKNIKLLNRKPLMAYTIEAALKSKIFDEIMVSTDSNDYAKIAIQYGAKVPYLRTKDLASDTASPWDMVREVLKNYKKENRIFDKCILLQPTSPLRTEIDIINAINLYKQKDAETVISVCETEHPAQWCFTLKEESDMTDFGNCHYRNTRRQDLPKTYHENGAIYIVDAEKVMKKEYDIYKNKCFAYIMSRFASIDIDRAEDLELVEYYMKK